MSDNELEEIAKLNAISSHSQDADDGSGDAPTRVLLPSYAPTPRAAATPLLRTPAREDRIRHEAENVKDAFRCLLCCLKYPFVSFWLSVKRKPL